MAVVSSEREQLVLRKMRDQILLVGHSPDFVGKTFSSSSNFWSQLMTKSMYVGAGSDTRRWFWSGQRKLSLDS